MSLSFFRLPVHFGLLPLLYRSLGRVFQKQGNTSLAVLCFREAVRHAPDDEQGSFALGKALLLSEQLDAAANAFRAALRCRSDFPEAYNNLGVVLEMQGNSEDAGTCYLAALQLKPDYAAAHTNLGNVYLNQNRLAEAEACHQEALHVDSRYVEAYCNLASVLNAEGRFPEAEESCRAALRLQPDFAGAHNNLGIALKNQGRSEEAAGAYQSALELQPDLMEAHVNLAILRLDFHRLAQAMPYLEKDLKRNPNSFLAHDRFGVALQALEKLDAAFEHHQKALSINPDCIEALNNMGNVLQVQGKLDEAIEHYRKALSLNASFAVAHGNLLFCLNYHPDLPAEVIYEEYRCWNIRQALAVAPQEGQYLNDRDPGRRLRIGYVSADLRRHSANYFIEPLLAGHDKTQVEVFAYAQVAQEDDVSVRLKTHIDHWRSTVYLSDDKMAELIRKDRIDILIDLAGHTGGNRLLVFARKPAPIQVSWLGYGYTTGLEAMDYFLADRALAPHGCEPLFSERIARLPVWVAYRPIGGIGEVGELPALQGQGITFGTLSRSVRLNHRVIRTWAALLHRLPNSRLIINNGSFRSEGMQSMIKEKFAAHGIAPDRLAVGCNSPPWDVLRTIDISLDCFPHNSGTTLFESLYMGIPFVTLADRPSVGRMGAAILTGLGHPEWIATSEAEYVEKAVTLASDIDALAALRAGLRQKMDASLLMDEAAFVRSVEAAYRGMWQEWVAA